MSDSLLTQDDLAIIKKEQEALKNSMNSAISSKEREAMEITMRAKIEQEMKAEAIKNKAIADAKAKSEQEAAEKLAQAEKIKELEAKLAAQGSNTQSQGSPSGSPFIPPSDKSVDSYSESEVDSIDTASMNIMFRDRQGNPNMR